MQTDVYLVNMLPDCGVAPILPYASKRADLKDRILAVYCGKSAAEWYSRYCQTVLRIASDRGIREDLVAWLRQNAMFYCAKCAADDVDAACYRAADLRIHADKQICECCYDDMVVYANAAAPLPAWGALTVFDPFVGLV